jgi:hypothetical protein
VNFVLGVVHRVEHPVEAARCLSETLGFNRVETDGDFQVVENGALTIRLVPSDQPQGWLELDAASEDLSESMGQYLPLGWHPDESGKEPHWATPTREELRLLGPHRFALTLFREYSEDELGILPELPTSIPWEEDADQLVRELLRIVPLAFRDSARERIVKAVETDVLVAGQLCVTRGPAVRAMVRVTPDFQHHSLREEIEQRGLEWLDYLPRESAC